MIEFVQNYGLWIALAGVFVAMHWFGMGCCGGHRKPPAQRNQEINGEGPKGDKASGADPKSGGSCH
jgi:hypothetical protein